MNRNPLIALAALMALARADSPFPVTGAACSGCPGDTAPRRGRRGAMSQTLASHGQDILEKRDHKGRPVYGIEYRHLPNGRAFGPCIRRNRYTADVAPGKKEA